MELTAVPATQFSSVQLTDILNACFEAYLVPVTQSVEGFVQRFSAEGMTWSIPASGWPEMNRRRSRSSRAGGVPLAWRPLPCARPGAAKAWAGN